MIKTSHYTKVQRIFDIFIASRGVIRPHFFLVGASGSGKTNTANQLAEEYKLPILEINAAQLTKEGTAGNSLSKALSPLMQMNADQPKLIFVDEFDKLFLSSDGNNSVCNEVTLGVQNEFLKVVESNKASVFGDYGKYVNVDVSKCLFIFAGAFNGADINTLDDLRSFGIKTEFLGRVGLFYQMQSPTLAALLEAMQNSDLLKNYLELHKDASRTKVEKELSEAITESYEMNTLGFRLINTLIHSYFIEGGLPKVGPIPVTFTKSLSLPSLNPPA